MIRKKKDEVVTKCDHLTGIKFYLWAGQAAVVCLDYYCFGFNSGSRAVFSSGKLVLSV